LEIAKDIDENKSVLDWNRSGLFVGAFEKTKFKFYNVNTKTGRVENIPIALDLPGELL
jgi:hypothetical protein